MTDRFVRVQSDRPPARGVVIVHEKAHRGSGETKNAASEGEAASSILPLSKSSLEESGALY